MSLGVCIVRQAPVICVMAPPIHLGAWSMAINYYQHSQARVPQDNTTCCMLHASRQSLWESIHPQTTDFPLLANCLWINSADSYDVMRGTDPNIYKFLPFPIPLFPLSMLE